MPRKQLLCSVMLLPPDANCPILGLAWLKSGFEKLEPAFGLTSILGRSKGWAELDDFLTTRRQFIGVAIEWSG